MEARKNKIRYGIGIALTIILTIDLLPYLWLLVSSFTSSPWLYPERLGGHSKS